MKLLFFLRDITDCGGIQQTTCNLINSLVEDNDIQTLSLFHKNKTPFFHIDSRIANIALFNRKVNQRNDFLLIKSELSDLLKNVDYDILIIQGTLFSTYIPRKCWQNNNIIVCEHGHYGMGTPFGLHALGKKIAIKRYRFIVTLTTIDKDVYSRHTKNKSKIVCIPNASVPLDFEPNYDVESKLIISCGRLDRIKQFEQAVLAASIVFSKHPSWSWLIYGDGPNYDNLKKMITKFGLSEKVILCGYEANKKKIYKDKAIFVVTSKFEGFGMVLLEALQFKIPVVSYDVKFGPKEIVKNGFNGYLIKPNSYQFLASKICELIENKSLRVSLSNNAHESITSFSKEKIIQRWKSLFDEIINK